MKKLLHIIFAFIIMMSIISCNNRLKNTNIDILICENPISPKLTDDLCEILQPFKKGDTLIYLPQGIVFNTSGKVSYVKQKGWMDKIRGNITKNTSFLILKEKISNHLKEIDISKLILKEPLGINDLSKFTINYNVVLGFSSNVTTNPQSFAFKLFTNKIDIVTYVKDSILVKRPDSKILIVYNPTFAEDPDTRLPSGASLSDVSQAEPLRQELKKIIDTKRSFKEREDIANKVWSEYFDPKVYIDNIMDGSPQFPEHWPSGKGKNYLAHLVILPTIMDIKIIKIELNKETQKISSLKVSEIRNESKIGSKNQ